jgi:hypothetical protein
MVIPGIHGMQLPWRCSRPPLDHAAVDWIEDRILWLAEEFGSDATVHGELILPTAEAFPPDPGTGGRTLQSFCDVICARMGVDPSLVRLEWHDDAHAMMFADEEGRPVPSAFGGLFECDEDGITIKVSRSESLDTPSLIFTLAHELAHVRLHGEERADADAFDGELLTDLTASMLGFGIFGASSPRDWFSAYGVWPGTELLRPEYMSAPMHGCALACLAWVRGERRPLWSRRLSSDVRPYFRRSIRRLDQQQGGRLAPLARGAESISGRARVAHDSVAIGHGGDS